jgi:hypothetical protein
MSKGKDSEEKTEDSTGSAGRYQRLTDMLRWRYDAVARENIPDQLRSLVERFGASGGASKHDQTGKPQQHTKHQPSLVTCPYILSRPWEKARIECCGAGRRLLMVPQGGGSLPSSPKPTDL